MIQCAVRRDGTNSPFTIPSQISLPDLRTTVAEKLNLFPDRVILRYRLDSDKAKDGVTSIQTSDELDFFKARLRALTVPPRLTNGKPSTRPIKKVVVYFEAMDIDDQGTGSGNARSSDNGCAAVCSIVTHIFKLTIFPSATSVQMCGQWQVAKQRLSMQRRLRPSREQMSMKRWSESCRNVGHASGIRKGLKAQHIVIPRQGAAFATRLRILT